ncbi:MAG: 4Fe-4S binding protein [Candidatus Bathyarchaeota archaeon]|nr:4Fe-4S binding protein [Candidatus Bathyarchaeota archaeon]MDH5745360.1 4Fe-4S binding protein [Candidatus Bathyarchaeota archaeon]
MQIYINEEFCKGCGFCVHFCPTKVLVMSNKLCPKGNFVAVVKDPDKCTACRLCELVCPDFAISIEADEKPTGILREEKQGENLQNSF